MTTVVAQSPSCDWIQGADNESNQIKSNQIHPSPTKQQQLRTKIVVLGFSALDAALCLEQTWFHCKPWFRTDPVISRLSSKESFRHHLRCYPDLWMCKVEIPGSL